MIAPSNPFSPVHVQRSYVPVTPGKEPVTPGKKVFVAAGKRPVV
jgi:hypothetical protein